MKDPLSSGDIRDRLLTIFEQTRQSPGAPYEPERLLAFLTEPPAPKGGRARDTFAGRRRYVRLMNTIQLETGVCFTQQNWEQGFGLDELTKLVRDKRARPDQGLRLAKQRLVEARRRCIAEPMKFGVLTLPLLVLAGFADSWAGRIALALVWIGIVCGVATLSISEVRYGTELVRRIATRAGQESLPAATGSDV